MSDKTTLVILGSHPRSRALFDFERADCDVWVFNEAAETAWVKRCDAVFQMHSPVIWRNPLNRNDPKHYEWLKSGNTPPIYMQDVYPDVPKSVKYPLDEILAMLNNDPDHFLSSSVAEAIALAVYQGCYRRIEVYGVAMETNTEYQWQREGVAFWKGFAMGRGVEFYFADETYRTPVYGYEGKVTVEYEQFDKRIVEVLPMMEKAGQEYMALVQKMVLATTDFEKEDNSPLLYKLSGELVQKGGELGVLDGIRQENMKYKKRADTMKNAAGGEYLFSRQEFESNAAQLRDRAGMEQTNLAAFGGQLELLHHNIVIAAKDSPKRARLVANYRTLMDEYLKCNNRGAVLRGAMQENFNYMAYLDKHIRAAGGRKSEAVILEQMKNV